MSAQTPTTRDQTVPVNEPIIEPHTEMQALAQRLYEQARSAGFPSTQAALDDPKFAEDPEIASLVAKTARIMEMFSEKGVHERYAVRGLSAAHQEALFNASEQFVMTEPWNRLFLGHCLEFEHKGKRYFAHLLGAGGGCPPTLNIYMSFRDYLAARDAAKDRQLAEGTFLRTTFGEAPVECDADRQALSGYPHLEKRPLDFMKLTVPPNKHPQPVAVSAGDIELITVALRIAVEASAILELAPGRKAPTAEKSYLEDYLPTTSLLEDSGTLWMYPAAALKWRCHNRDCNNATTTKCAGSKAVCFCCKACQKKEWKAGYKDECPRFKALMDRTEEVAGPDTFPMPWCKMTCAALGVGFEGYLRRAGLFGVGWWEAEYHGCHLQDAKPLTCEAPLLDMAEGLHLPPEQLPSQEVVAGGAPLTTWAAWYQARGVSISSPAPLALHRALTVYHAIHIAGLASNRALTVHLVGPEPEVLQLGALKEVASLLPGMRLTFVLVGPAVPDGLNEHRAELGPKCNAVLFATDYMTFVKSSEFSTPGLIVGLNAGVAASHPKMAAMLREAHPWGEVVQYAATMQVPALFTDYTREAAQLGLEVCNAAVEAEMGAVPVETLLNPFRMPLNLGRAKAHGNGAHSDFPSWSDGFLFGFSFEPS